MGMIADAVNSTVSLRLRGIEGVHDKDIHDIGRKVEDSLRGRVVEVDGIERLLQIIVGTALPACRTVDLPPHLVEFYVGAVEATAESVRQSLPILAGGPS